MGEKLKVGLGTSTVHPETTAGAFQTAAELGYDGVELMVGVDRSSTDIDHVASLQDEYHMPVLSVHSPCLVITQNTWSSDPWEKLEHLVRNGYQGHVIHEISTRKMPSIQARREKLKECLSLTRAHIENARLS